MVRAGWALAFGLVAGAASAATPVASRLEGADFAEARAICRSVERVAPPADQLPSPAERAALKGCSSEALYYGIGVKRDEAKALKCALAQRADPNWGSGPEFGGQTILAQIYANGRGAPRNLDLAIRMVCEADWYAPVDTDTLVKALAARRGKPSAQPFDYCQVVNPGYSNVTIAQCTAFDARRKAPERAGRLAGVIQGLSPAGRAAYARLERALEAYARARADGERGDYVLARHLGAVFRETLLDQRADLIGKLATGHGPAGTPTSYAEADRKLNATYRGVISALPVKADDDVGRDGVRTAQRAWIGYRDAWLDLVRTAWPKASVDGVAALVTRQREHELDCLDSDSGDKADRCD